MTLCEKYSYLVAQGRRADLCGDDKEGVAADGSAGWWREESGADTGIHVDGR